MIITAAMDDDNDVTPRAYPAPLHLPEPEPELGRRVTALELVFARVQKRAWAVLIAVVGGLGGAGCT